MKEAESESDDDDLPIPLHKDETVMDKITKHNKIKSLAQQEFLIEKPLN